ncbi:MAG TPA: histidine kinase [Rhodospirillaceae bacterium]|nr:histidine kinase [Rhodospirillaceae bacterium]
MFSLSEGRKTQKEAEAKLRALGKSQAVIEFKPDGTILTANKNFLDVMGYTLPEIEGRHHAMFVDSDEKNSAEYREFWAALAQGEHRSAEFKRLAKDGREVWLQASYNPVADSDGKTYKVVKFASDITEAKRRTAEFEGQLAAIGRSQAVIEFEPNGTILSANRNFLDVMGYELFEIEGTHHSMFIAPGDRETAANKNFWTELAEGKHHVGEFKRIAKDGREVWIQASYTPIADPSGRIYKVVKFASDITREKLRAADYEGQIAAINKSQAVIEFNLDGTILTANQNFLAAMGYELSEVQGLHHSMFVTAEEKGSEEYRAFWAALNQGEYRAGEFQRVGKGGREVWIQASYNPIADASGAPYKVVKYASDVTATVLARKRAEYVSTLMEDTAAGSEQLSASVREISESMDKSREIANDAFDRVIHADQSTQRLDSAADQIGEVISLITGIAEQTNLLALNATIEAARAGEAGKGFAVVAGEVKNLANQARRATEQIEGEINNMRDVSADVVDSLSSIKERIEAVREYVSTTAAAIEEQTAVANEMSSSMQRAAAEAAGMGGSRAA